MREIKFRAWHKGQNKMYPAEEMGRDELTIATDGRGFVNVSEGGPQFSEYITDMIPLQYTGLNDKDGVEIYEGDIIIKPANRNRHLEVVYSDDVACFEVIHPVGARALCGYVNSEGGVLIIGNVYKNTELL